MMALMVEGERSSRRRLAVMREAGSRVRVVDDHMFEIRHPNGSRRGTCRLQLFTAGGLRPVAVATWVAGDGCSLTNCAESFAAEAWRRHFPQDAHPPVWVQRQILDPELDDGEYHVVTFETSGNLQLSSPSWHRIAEKELAELVGTEVDPSQRAGFTPPPEPVRRLHYGIRWVATLPRPRPFRQPDCMPAAGPRLLQRLTRQLLPRRDDGDCCWYHGGDWAQVSRTAIRLVREAKASNVPEDEIARVVVARAESDGVSGWKLAALDSLVDPTVGIFVDRDGTSSFYVNGQHRAQAMLDAGVRRTLIVRYWEEMPT
jgi:hypothetical protein